MNSKYVLAQAGVDDQDEGVVGLIHHEQVKVFPLYDPPLTHRLIPQLQEL